MAPSQDAPAQDEICIVGHVSADRNVFKGKPERAPGGGGLFGGVAAARLGASARVVTKAAVADRPPFMKELGGAGAQIDWIDCEKDVSTVCENDYPDDNPENRRQRMLSLASPFTKAEVDALPGADILIVNPLWYGEVPDDLLPALRSRCQFFVGDAQGFLRHCVPRPASDSPPEEEAIEWGLEKKDWQRKKEFLSLFDVFKIDSQEALVLCGTTDLEKAGADLIDWGARAVLGTEASGLCYTERLPDGQLAMHRASFGDWHMEGRTGRGDTATVSLSLALRRGCPAATAARFAAQVTTDKMQHRGGILAEMAAPHAARLASADWQGL